MAPLILKNICGKPKVQTTLISQLPQAYKPARLSEVLMIFKKAPACFAMLILLGLTCLLAGCAAPLIGAVSDERTLGTHVNDSVIEANVKSALVEASATKIMDINVYSFYGDVFLIGEADPDFAKRAAEVASGVKDVSNVTSYLYPLGTTTSKDLLTEADINQKLLFTSGIPSSKVQVDVWGGQAVLLGILNNQEQIDQVIELVKGVSGVRSVKSYLILKRETY